MQTNGQTKQKTDKNNLNITKRKNISEIVLKTFSTAFSLDKNKEFLEDLNLQTGKIVATSDEAGKIIDNFCCYIATISSSNEAKQAKIGDKIKVRLSNNAEVPATITSIANETDDDILLILQVNEQIEELTNYRKISFDLIWWDETGLKVPNQAIVEENELNYVVRNRAGYLSKILVKITEKGDKYSIVTAYTTDELKELGFTSEEINNYKIMKKIKILL